MKKVLFVATVDSHIELFHLPFLKMFKEKGWETSVATESDKPIKYCDKKISMPIKRSPFKLISNFKAICKLRKIIKEEKYDIIHCHTPMGGVVARMAARSARKNGTRVIYTAHGFHFYKGAPLHFWMMFYPVEWYLAKYTDTLITINNEDYERAKKKFGKRCKDIQYVPGVGVDPKKFEKKMSAKEKSELRKKLGLKNDDKVLICIGRLDKNKNQGFLIRAMDELTRIDSSYHLLLVGPDEINGEYHRLVYKLGLEKNVHFLGFRKDIPELLQISDIAVSASKREGLPVNIIEFVFTNHLVLVVDCRGMIDISKRANGLVTIVKANEQLFVKRIVELLLNKETTNETKSISNELKTFSLSAVLKTMDVVYFNNKKPMRVLHVIGGMGYGGAENFVMNVYRVINKKEIQFDFLVNRDGAFDEEIRKMGGRIYKTPALQKVGGIIYRNRLRHFLRQHKNEYHIIHSHINQVSGVILECARKEGIPVRIAHSHSSSFSSSVILINIYKKFLGSKIPKNSTLLFACSDLAAKYLFPNNYNEATIIKNGIDMQRFSFDENKRNVIRKKYNIPNSTFVVGHVGRFNKQKNHAFLIDVFNELLRINPDSILFLVGSGEEEQMILEKIRKLGINNKVIIAGNTNDTSAYYSMFDCFVFPSISEGLPLSLVEAQANNLHCVVSDSISKEVQICENIDFVPLRNNPTEWVDKIVTASRKKTYRLRKDFDVHGASDVLCHIYKKYWN